MNKIRLNDLNLRNDYSLSNFMRGALNMDFIKVGNNWMLKGSNGLIVSEEDKLKMEKKELILQDISSNKCQGETTRKIKRINKKIEEIKDDSIKETNTTL